MKTTVGEYIYSDEVRQARAKGAPVVALESTLITHGLPYPVNVETARALEQEVRAAGAVPATIALLAGRIQVGLNDDQLLYLGRASTVRKCSRRDLAIAVARKQDGATTVAGTMLLAHRAGISVFATGGIGGVHRGHPFDISADIDELGRSPVTVVCAGAKAILDLPLTLEALETRGVPVVGYGTDDFPAFYSRSSGLPVDVRCDTPGKSLISWRPAGRWIYRQVCWSPCRCPQTMNFPPAEAERAIAQALQEADDQGIMGKT
jgi:pseudouridine-5'-phosphate glycosidase